jgi:hypothetical protein
MCECRSFVCRFHLHTTVVHKIEALHISKGKKNADESNPLLNSQASRMVCSSSNQQTVLFSGMKKGRERRKRKEKKEFQLSTIS